MTKKVFQAAALIVNGVRLGHWTDEPPTWVDLTKLNGNWPSYERAVGIAEAFIALFKQFNPLFNEQKFLEACGLMEKSKKGK